MKKIILLIGAVLAFATMAIAGPWSTTCVFSDNVCLFNMQPQAGLTPGFGIANLFVPGVGGGSGTTLTLTFSPDNVTFYAPYSTNTTAYDTYTGDNTTAKAYGMYLDGAYYIKVSASDNAFNGQTLYLQGRF